MLRPSRAKSDMSSSILAENLNQNKPTTSLRASSSDVLQTMLHTKMDAFEIRMEQKLEAFMREVSKNIEALATAKSDAIQQARAEYAIVSSDDSTEEYLDTKQTNIFMSVLGSGVLSDDLKLHMNVIDLVIMASQSNDAHMIHKVNEMTVKALEPDQLRDFLLKLKANGAKCDTFLFAHRVKWIEEFIQNVPVFSWKMPECRGFDQLPDVVTFFRSNRNRMTFNCGMSIIYAQNIARNNIINCENYLYHSADMTPFGTGKDACVKIVNTRKYYERKLNKHSDKVKELQLELNELKAFLGVYFRITDSFLPLKFKIHVFSCCLSTQ